MNKLRINQLLLTSFIVVVILCLNSVKSFSQEKDDKPVNLKILPKDISEKELDKIMDSFNYALGVKCSYCHADPNDKSGKKTDYAADLNPKKLVARTMYKLVNTINKDLLKESKAIIPELSGVSCASCHHGSPNIKLLDEQLFGVYQKDGLAASLSEYENLRKQYNGNFVYDFSFKPLLMFASKVFNLEKYDDAIAIASKNSELYPEAVQSFTFLGNAFNKKGNKEEAIRNFEKAIKLDPNNRFANQQLKKLKEVN